MLHLLCKNGYLVLAYIAAGRVFGPRMGKLHWVEVVVGWALPTIECSVLVGGAHPTLMLWIGS